MADVAACAARDGWAIKVSEKRAGLRYAHNSSTGQSIWMQRSWRSDVQGQLLSAAACHPSAQWSVEDGLDALLRAQ